MGPPGYIYFLQAVGTDRIKIGKTGNMDRRMAQLRGQQHPFPHLLLHVESVEDMDAADLAYKRQYLPYRVYKEWYVLPEEIVAQLSKIVSEQKPQEKVRPLATIGNLAQLRAILLSEGHEGADANPHRALAYYQRSMLRQLMECDYLRRDWLVGSDNESQWNTLVLDEAIRLGRIVEETPQMVCHIHPAFIPHSWYDADWIDEFVYLACSPKTYNKALDQQQRDFFLFEARRKFNRKIG